MDGCKGDGGQRERIKKGLLSLCGIVVNFSSSGCCFTSVSETTLDDVSLSVDVTCFHFS